MLGLAAAVPLAPVLLWQGRRVRRTVAVLPEAAGPRGGVAGSGTRGSAMRLLILGDSSAAGVGVDDQRDALAGRLVAKLAAASKRPVDWLLVARTGIETSEAAGLLDGEARDAGPFDVAVVALGVNDVTRMRPVGRWLSQVDTLHALLHRRYRVQQVFWSGLPPMHRFPALPQPLRAVIGLHARALDDALERWCAARPLHARPLSRYVPLPEMTDVSMVAADGFHPGPAACEAWAGRIVEHLIAPSGAR